MDDTRIKAITATARIVSLILKHRHLSERETEVVIKAILILAGCNDQSHS
jgi:hypothetical protein